MTEVTMVAPTTQRLRFVTASSLFDGHDASINIMRRLLQGSGAEVIHLGHNRSVETIVETAIQEDAHAIAVSSYQGGHVEFFRYMVDMLHERGAGHIRVFGGGGGVIVADELRALHDYGVTRIYSPDDGRELGLQGMIDDMMRRATGTTPLDHAEAWLRSDRPLSPSDRTTIAQLISLAEGVVEDVGGREDVAGALRARLQGACERRAPVVGITGTGGAGKSSLTDELVRRFLRDFPDCTIGILSVDPSRQKTGGALLGDRIRMNAIYQRGVYMRSLATRGSRSELSAAVDEAVSVLQAAGFDLILLETSGIGQGDAAVATLADVSVYVMTSEFG
ncbi:MAG: cobalamin-dependent protein, partial [Firmicutes bacterium]|nr:cobalamin-dependent protein [Bacillota bacterium]